MTLKLLEQAAGPDQAAQLSLADLLTRPRLRTCVLCGRRAAWNAVFVPSDPPRFGAPAGKVRLIRYALCGRCHRRPDRTERAEARIMADLALRGGFEGNDVYVVGPVSRTTTPTSSASFEGNDP